MSHVIFEPDWVAAYCTQLQGNAAYKKAAASWQWPLVLRIQPDPSIGLPEGRAVWLDLFKGDCRDGRVATAADIESAPYVISADAFTWKQVLDKKLEPISGLLRGKLKLEKGNIIVLAGYIQAARCLVETAQEIETIFPEGVA